MHFSSTFTVFLPINDNRDSHATQNWQWIFPTSIVVVSVGNWQNSSDDFIDVFDNHWIRTFGLFSWGRGGGVCPFRNHPQASKEGQVSHMYFPFTTPPYKYSGLCVYHLQSKLPIYTPSHLVLLPLQLTAVLDTRVTRLPDPTFGFCSHWRPPRSWLIPFRLTSW